MAQVRIGNRRPPWSLAAHHQVNPAANAPHDSARRARQTDRIRIGKRRRRQPDGQMGWQTTSRNAINYRTARHLFWCTQHKRNVLKEKYFPRRRGGLPATLTLFPTAHEEEKEGFVPGVRSTKLSQSSFSKHLEPSFAIAGQNFQADCL